MMEGKEGNFPSTYMSKLLYITHAVPTLYSNSSQLNQLPQELSVWRGRNHHKTGHLVLFVNQFKFSSATVQLLACYSTLLYAWIGVS